MSMLIRLMLGVLLAVCAMLVCFTQVSNKEVPVDESSCKQFDTRVATTEAVLTDVLTHYDKLAASHRELQQDIVVLRRGNRQLQERVQILEQHLISFPTAVPAPSGFKISLADAVEICIVLGCSLLAVFAASVDQESKGLARDTIADASDQTLIGPRVGDPVRAATPQKHVMEAPAFDMHQSEPKEHFDYKSVEYRFDFPLTRQDKLSYIDCLEEMLHELDMNALLGGFETGGPCCDFCLLYPLDELDEGLIFLPLDGISWDFPLSQTEKKHRLRILERLLRRCALLECGAKLCNEC